MQERVSKSRRGHVRRAQTVEAPFDCRARLKVEFRPCIRSPLEKDKEILGSRYSAEIRRSRHNTLPLRRKRLLKTVRQRSVQPMHRPRMMVVVGHEDLDRPLLRLIAIPEPCRNITLEGVFKSIVSHAAAEMHFVPDTEQKGECLEEPSRIILWRDAVCRQCLDQFFCRRQPGNRKKRDSIGNTPVEPDQCMQIAESAGAFLDVRFEQFHGIAEPLMSAANIFEDPVHKPWIRR